MLPLSLAKEGEKGLVVRVTGNDDARKRLEALGFVEGTSVRVLSAAGDGNVIVELRQSRLAVTRVLSEKVMVSLS